MDIPAMKRVCILSEVQAFKIQKGPRTLLNVQYPSDVELILASTTYSDVQDEAQLLNLISNPKPRYG